MIKTIEQNIEDWLLSKGFPFEIKCSRALKNAGFHVEQSVHYFDDEIKTHRELDICAWKSFHVEKFTFNLTLMIECKTSESPWIVFTGGEKHPSELISNLIISKNGEKMLSKIEVEDRNTFAFSILENEVFAYNFIQMKKSNNDKDKDHAYEAIMQSSKAALNLKEKSDDSELTFCNLYIPVVIVDKNLFKVSESNDSDNLKIDSIKFCKHGKLFAFSERPLLVHHIVSGEHLNEYCKTIANDFDYFFSKYTKEIQEIAKENPKSSDKGKYSFK